MINVSNTDGCERNTALYLIADDATLTFADLYAFAAQNPPSDVPPPAAYEVPASDDVATVRPASGVTLIVRDSEIELAA